MRLADTFCRNKLQVEAAVVGIFSQSGLLDAFKIEIYREALLVPTALALPACVEAHVGILRQRVAGSQDQVEEQMIDF